MICRLKDMVRSRSGEWVISFTTSSDFSETFDDLYGKDLDVTFKRVSKMRSLDANAFAWVLINKIAQKLQEKEPRSGWTPMEVYRTAIRDVAGACTLHCIPNDQVDQFVNDWLSLGMGFQVETAPSKIEGCTNGWFWKGSHLYDTQQMSTLINLLIQQAEELGIPTIPDEEAKRLLGNWEKRHEKHNARSE